MEYQRIKKSAQKEQLKADSSSLHQTSLNGVTSSSLFQPQETIGNQAVLNELHSNDMQPDTTRQRFVEPGFGHDFRQIPIHSSETAVSQMQLRVNQPGDIYEQDADRRSEEIMHMPVPFAQAQGSKAAQLEAPEAPASELDVLQSTGQPLDASTRAFMEPRFGHDFSKVRIHTDERADQSTHPLHAVAYTIGKNIVFRSGYYSPQTDEGKSLLAHELTHVIQQSQVTPLIQRQDDGNSDNYTPSSQSGYGYTPAPAADSSSGGVTMDNRLPSKQWSIQPGFSGSIGWPPFPGKSVKLGASAAALAMTLTNHTTGYSYLLTFVGGGLGAGTVELAMANPSSTQFTTTQSVMPTDFNSVGTLKSVDLTPLIGSSLAYINFWSVPTSSTDIDIGGLQVGGGIGAGVYVGRFSVWLETETTG